MELLPLTEDELDDWWVRRDKLVANGNVPIIGVVCPNNQYGNKCRCENKECVDTLKDHFDRHNLDVNKASAPTQQEKEATLNVR